MQNNGEFSSVFDDIIPIWSKSVDGEEVIHPSRAVADASANLDDSLRFETGEGIPQPSVN
jgi:hypothetical protein